MDERLFERSDEGHRGLADPRGRMGEEMLAFRDRTARVREEVRLTRPNAVERPRDGGGGGADRRRILRLIQRGSQQVGCRDDRRDMKGCAREERESILSG